MQEIIFHAMGSEIFCALDTSHPRAQERLERMPAMFETWERIYSRFRSESELSRLNAGTGQSVRVSETLWRVLKFAQTAQEMSAGLVTPTMLPALEAAGYDRSFDAMSHENELVIARSHPERNGVESKDGDVRCIPIAAISYPSAWISSTQLEECRAKTARNDKISPYWEMNEITRTVYLAPGTRLDLGGVGKGWAAEQAARYLGELGPALVDAGGDMVMTAPRADGTAWYIGIENPFDPEDDEDDALPTIGIYQGASATSGQTYRKWIHDGKPMHHLIDPRTGLPAISDVLTATVMAPTILAAEVATKVALILGSVAGMDWIEMHSSSAGVLVLEDGTVLSSKQMENYVVNA